MKFLVLATCVAACSAATINVGIGGYLGGGYVAGIGAGIGYRGLATGYTGYAGAPLVVSAPYAAAPLIASAPAVATAPIAAAAPVAAAAPLIAAAPVVADVPIVDAPFVYSGPLNLNTELASFPNGAVVPVDEPAVAAARAEHLAIQGVAVAAPIASAAPLIAAAPVAAAAPIVDAPFVYSGPLNLNTELTSLPNGAVVPVDEPAVVAARAEHLATQGAALAAAAPIVVAAPIAAAAPLIAAAPVAATVPIVDAPFVYSGPLNLNTELASLPNGAVVPVDEPAVAAARAEHLAAFLI